MPTSFEDMLYHVEHALSLYAYSFVLLPAHQLYETDVLSEHQKTIDNCHIYLIGFTPKIKMEDVREEDGKLVISCSILGTTYDVEDLLPSGMVLRQEEEYFFVEDEGGNRYFPSAETIAVALQQKTGVIDFKVIYIGQAYGSDGSRNAFDRLKKHETLQKIALKGIPEGYEISLCLLEIQPANKIATVFNPMAQDDEDSNDRIKAGLDKLFNTDEKERVTLYEASLIRYFEPEFNKEFKNSFPSTNMKVLKDLASP